MFNSEITDKNSPVNAIRRVMTKKKKKIPRPPGISGVIEEDVEGEDEEDEEEEVVEEGNPAASGYQLERVHAEMSSEDEAEKPQKIDLFKKDVKEAKDEKAKDSKKDKKEKEKKDKKDSKKDKDKAAVGYNQDDIEKGKQLMSNTSFKSNLDRLRQKFKEQGKPGINESPEPISKKTKQEPIPTQVTEVKASKHNDDDYGRQSEVILGKQEPGGDLRTSAYGTNTRGLKDAGKFKPVTPDVKFGTSSGVTDKKKDTANSSEIFEKKKVAVVEAPSRANPENRGVENMGKAEGSFSSTKEGSSLSKAEQLKYEEDWNLKKQDSLKQKPKTPISLGNVKTQQPPANPPSFPKKKKIGGGSDNSWDEDKNPFE